MGVPDASRDAAGRLTTQGYWDRTWRSTSQGQRRVRRLRRRERLEWDFASVLGRALDRADRSADPPRVLEIGCANSIWLPYLARERRAVVEGVDFSERGCELARENLSAQGLAGTIVCADFFDYAPGARGRFDVVMSCGLVEHFTDIPSVLRTMAELLRPGGVLFASVPNLVGRYGRAQAMVDASVLAHHVALTPDDLLSHATAAGLRSIERGYCGGPPRVGSLNPSHARWAGATTARVFAQAAFGIDYAVSIAARAVRWRPTRTGPFVYVFGETAR